ncbi:MAG: glutamine synthetase family protein [Pseudomonadota bacterium]
MTDFGFAEHHGLWSEEQSRLAKEVSARITAEGLESIRLSFCDQHGLLRGKTLMAEAIAGRLGDGCALTTTLLLKDTSHRTVFPVWEPGGGFGKPELTGAADFIIVPDPATFKVLPWAHKTGWLLCDAYFPNGTPVSVSTRRLLRSALEDLHHEGRQFITGLEAEFHIFRIREDKLSPSDAVNPGTPPDVALLSQGYQYLTETRYDELEPLLERLRSTLAALDLPLRSMEVEFGPSQVEFTFAAQDALATADAMVLFRSAVKQVCKREGLLATFMCRPALENVFSSGWHLHQSLVDTASGANLFASDGTAPLSEPGLHYVGGLLAHADAASAFTTPTINGYKRYRPQTLAPDRISWGIDNRGSMIRVCGAPGNQTSHIENRAGEPAANPYLYAVSQLVAGRSGIETRTDPGPPSDMPYSAEAPGLPASLNDAIAALDNSTLYRSALGDEFIDYFCTIKRAEISRFLSEVTDWEQREYFQAF